ncbi:nucleoside triphosphate pyrophosphohydrolase [Mycobacterium europaeum]|uniref:nucleoside triphosphate pyrophosphohydrolase n=1 Tax=Mycobacterium europaeum TaxID=761804 RepID=UPI002AE0A7E1|nr:nucleoside triphosphate pyrophosphohydrolase [Mycobacterium europaeum]MEA1162291.1 nucleoside triphosphate pyrophosphohydrolase [Mycobacterium europaeum]
MGKLVRDKIPDIIRASGRTPHVITLTEGAYRRALYDKLREEVDELIAATATDALMEEAADVLEVVAAIAAERHVTFAGIVDAARQKRAEKGGFGMRLWLDGVEPNPEG